MADIDRKRKRSSNGVTLPSKKTILSSSVSNISITFAGEHGLRPIITSAKGIKIPSVAFEAFSHPSKGLQTKDSIILHSSKHPRLDYNAAIFSNDNLAHYIAIFDPASNNLKIVPSHHTQLQCKLRSAVPEESPRKTVANQRIALGTEFGTKKAKKAIASKTLNAITTDIKDEVQDAILQDVGEKIGVEEERDLAAELAVKPIPKPNIAADKVEDVYTIGNLIPPGDMRLLNVKEWQELARAEENIQSHHRFTAFRVADLGKGNDITRLKALKYLALLLRFHDLLRPGGRAGKKVPKQEQLKEQLAEYPDGLVDSVRRKFSENSELNKFSQEYLHTHICALSLFIDQWSTDISNIRDDMKLETKVVTQYFTELGCKMSALTEKERADRGYNKTQASSTRMAKLKLPLEFPKVRTGRRR